MASGGQPGGTSFQSWGRYPKKPQHALSLEGRSRPFPTTEGRDALPRGNGRSYGDSCLSGGYLITTERLDHLITFDGEKGVVRAEAGITLAGLHEVVAPRGWYLPVVPGTQYVTLGGAVANDVHGKNHHRAGTFGRHVRAFELLRSDGSRTLCTPGANQELYAATIGGLGLTGLITWVEVSLARLQGAWIAEETVPFSSVREFVDLSSRSESTHEYSVGWFDCFSYRKGRFRGMLKLGVPVDRGSEPPKAGRAASVPFVPPFNLLTAYGMRAFNYLYFAAGVARRSRRVPLARYLYPLDRIANWNGFYGPNGFMQLQCVLPATTMDSALDELLAMIQGSGQGTFLAVLKTFGNLGSPGLLSFPMPGVTLALDFPNRGDATIDLMRKCHALATEAGGRIYPAKDACMTPDTFKAGFPQWERLDRLRDPAIASCFWRRVTAAS